MKTTFKSGNKEIVKHTVAGLMKTVSFNSFSDPENQNASFLTVFLSIPYIILTSKEI